MKNTDQQNGLTNEQKTGFVLLLLFGITSVALGFLQLRNTIYTPFVIKPVQKEQQVVNFEDEASRLQKIDTDQDGINDYRELEFFQTSPYLPDTDSDGIDDKAEIDAGTDPLCPEGKTCGNILPTDQIELEKSIEKRAEDASKIGIFGKDINSKDQSENSNNILNILKETNPEIAELLSSPENIRKLLIDSGEISEADLKNINDADLIKLMQDVLIKQQTTEQNIDSQKQ